MSTIQDIIDDIRFEMTDEQSSRWTDAQIIQAIKKTVTRLNTVLFKNVVETGRAAPHDFTLAAGVDSEDLPADFMADYALFRTDQNKKLSKQSADSWEQLQSPAEATVWTIRGGKLYVGGAPTSSIAFRLDYWPLIDVSAYVAATTTPWSGKFDFIISEYAALRLKNIDEMDASFDSQLFQDMETSFIQAYSRIEPETLQRRGWVG